MSATSALLDAARKQEGQPVSNPVEEAEADLSAFQPEDTPIYSSTPLATCPECSETFDGKPMYAWRAFYQHVRGEHGWPEDQVDEHKATRGVVKPKVVTKPSAKGTSSKVNRERKTGDGKVTGPTVPKVGDKDIKEKLKAVQEVAAFVLTTVNPIIIGTAPMFLGIPPGVVLTRPDGTTVSMQETLAFSPGEAMTFGLAAAFGGESKWLTDMLMKALPPVTVMIAAAVCAAHVNNVMKLRAEIVEAMKQGRTAQPAPTEEQPAPSFGDLAA